MKARWSRWVDFWSQREHPRTLAMFRIALAAVILFDFVYLWSLDLVIPIFGTAEFGGITELARKSTVPWVYQLFPETPATAQGLHLTIVIAAVSLLLGCFTRTSALVLMIAWAQMSLISPMSDRGIDMLCRNALMVLGFSQAGAAWSIDAWWTTGKVRGNDETILAWPRYLMILQVLVMYFTAGVQKGGSHWMPFQGFSALYIIMQDYGVIRQEWLWVENQPWYFFTQVSTAVTMLWEWSTPIMGLFYWYRVTPERPGRLRAWTNRYHLHLWWLAIGVIFHVGIHITLDLGIFPWAMLATYICFVTPDEWLRFWDWTAKRMGRAQSQAVSNS